LLKQRYERGFNLTESITTEEIHQVSQLAALDVVKRKFVNKRENPYHERLHHVKPNTTLVRGADFEL
jgi:hypothetical protein